MDTVTAERRSEIMSGIGSRDTGPEILMARALRRARASGWRRCRRIGRIATPDFVWRRERVALFVDGDFWHGCPDCYRKPKSNREFWERKIRTNRARDVRQTVALRAAGWLVLRVFECEIRKERDARFFASLVARAILTPRRRHA